MVFNLIECKFGVLYPVETETPFNGKVLTEKFYVELVEYSYFGESDVLEKVVVNQIIELDKYLVGKNSDKYERTFIPSKIPEVFRFYLQK